MRRRPDASSDYGFNLHSHERVGTRSICDHVMAGASLASAADPRGAGAYSKGLAAASRSATDLHEPHRAGSCAQSWYGP